MHIYCFLVLVLIHDPKKHSHRCLGEQVPSAQGTQVLQGHLIFTCHTFHIIVSIISIEKGKPHYFRYG